ncbi:MAG: indole-3-glycerol phosphate synthase TrpC [Halanaerobiales bacterium]
MILDKIIKQKKEEIKLLKAPRNSLKEKLSKYELTIIAEIKKASPSKGVINYNFNPEKQLEKYISGGADAVSILTDKKFFQGSKEILKNLRKLTDIPLLRKEFIIDPIQIYESFFLGADIILLIAAVLEKEELKNLLKLTHELNMEAIVEVHSVEELNKVMDTEAEIIGVNNRNLKNFTVDLKNTEDIISEIKKSKRRHEQYIISESGIKDKSDIEYLKSLGIDGVLIGETLMRSEKSAQLIKEFKGD